MKKLLLSVAAMLIAGISFGQVKWGIIAGPNFSSVTSEAMMTTGKETSKLITHVRAGVTVDLPLAEEFYIGTGLLFAGKGGKAKDDWGMQDLKVNLSYLQLPINFLFKPSVGTGNLVLGAGPYLAYGLGGKYKNFVAPGSTQTEFKAFDDEAALWKLKRFDAGAGIVIGYEMPQGLAFGLNADLGLVNVADNTDNDRKFKNTSFGVSVGYKF